MSLPAHLRQVNVDLSIQKHLNDTWVVPGGLTARVFWSDPLADPTNLQEVLSELDYWFDVQFVARGAGQKLPTMVQIDAYYRVGIAGTEATHDRYGHKLTDLIDDLQATLTPAQTAFACYDFSSTPLSPVSQGCYLQIRSAQGQMGWIDRNARRQLENGLWRQIVTIRVWHRQDLQGTLAYY